MVKSNAIVYAGNKRTLGIGAGQMSRVDSSQIAVWKAGQAGLDLQGSIVASDAFFPFADGLLAAAEAGRLSGYTARRVGARPGGHRGCQPTGNGHGIHRGPPFSALGGAFAPRGKGESGKWKVRRKK